MTCEEAREQLEAARPDSGDFDEPELVDASSHVRDCPECRAVLHRRERFDRRVGRAMRDVPVPAGLKSRLLEALQRARADSGSSPAHDQAADGAAPDEAASTGRAGRERSSRRKLLVKFALAACAAAAVLFVVVRSNRTAPEPLLTLDDVLASATLDGSALPAFDGNFKAPLPGGVWRDPSRFAFRPSAAGDLTGDDGFHRAALYEFRIRSPRGGSIRGVLLVVPKERLQDPPAAPTINLERTDVYARRPSGQYHAFSWTSESDGVVYVCFVPAGGESLKALRQALDVRIA